MSKTMSRWLWRLLDMFRRGNRRMDFGQVI